jgi:hypothetical protein
VTIIHENNGHRRAARSPRAEEQLGATPEAGPREAVVEREVKPRRFRVGKLSVSRFFDRPSMVADVPRRKDVPGAVRLFARAFGPRASAPAASDPPLLAPKYPELEYFSPRRAPNGRISAVSTPISGARNMLSKPLSRRRTASEFGAARPPRAQARSPGDCPTVTAGRRPELGTTPATRAAPRPRGRAGFPRVKHVSHAARNTRRTSPGRPRAGAAPVSFRAVVARRRAHALTGAALTRENGPREA